VGRNFPHFPYIPLRGRGQRGGAKLHSLSLHSPPREGTKGVGRNFTHFPYIPLRGRGSKGWGDRFKTAPILYSLFFISHLPHLPIKNFCVFKNSPSPDIRRSSKKLSFYRFFLCRPVWSIK
jgi:hypothetical protein